MRGHASGQGARRIAAVLAVWLVFTGGAACGKSARPEKWAQPVASAVLENWYQVDEGLYRSRQPDRKGFEEARTKGIRTIINLRAEYSDAKLVKGLGFELVEIPLSASSFTQEEILSVLRAIEKSAKPVLMHCQHGSDRTGVVSAAYRILYQGWTKDEAIAELKDGGFGFHRFYVNIPAFIRNLDVARTKARLAPKSSKAAIRPAAAVR